MNAVVTRYRVMAYTVGVLLIVLVFVGIPLQVFAASVAQARGYDVDKPRNLAKSVTVE